MTDAGTAIDTSVLVPALASWHQAHRASRALVLEERPRVPEHVLTETYSVLTRLPSPHRLTPEVAAATVSRLPLRLCGLPGRRIAAVMREFGALGIRGGAVYDAMIAAAARHHGLTLVTRDVRARPTYEAVGVRYRLM